jgi:ElaB/YqjD/DUF883 family membrane-anchored ribosome-binding protein
MISDTFGRNLAFGLLIFMLLYYRFIRFTINMKGEYNNRKCSPINMFMSGLIGSGGENIFDQCTSNVTEESINNEFKSYADSRQRNMDATYANLEGTSEEIAQEAAQDANAYLKDAEATAEAAEQAKKDAANMQTTIEETSGVLQNSISSIRRIAQNFADAAKEFVNSSPVQQL